MNFSKELGTDKSSVTMSGCLPHAVTMAGLLLSANLLVADKIRKPRVWVSKSEHFNSFKFEVFFNQFWEGALYPCGVSRYIPDMLVYPHPQITQSKIPDFLMVEIELLFNDIIAFASNSPAVYGGEAHSGDT